VVLAEERTQLHPLPGQAFTVALADNDVLDLMVDDVD
jgi:hypothetical protein